MRSEICGFGVQLSVIGLCVRFNLVISLAKAVVPPAQTRRIILRDTPVSMGIR